MLILGRQMNDLDFSFRTASGKQLTNQGLKIKITQIYRR